MKKIWILFLLVMLSTSLSAQINLVPNPSFEDTIACPLGAAQLNVASGWMNPTLASPDYFNSCNTGNYGVPVNIYGNENAHFGVAYAGMINVVGGSNFREYIETQLLDTLLTGKKYCVSFYVSLSDSSPYAVNNLGIYFSNSFINSSSNTILNYTPQIVNNSNNELIAKNGWIQVVDSFIAQGGEEFITIGCFTNGQNTDTTYLGGPPFWADSYHFIDDVSVIICDSLVGIETYGEKSKFSIFPNPSKGIFNFSSELKFKKIEVYNTLGESVLQIENNKNYFGKTLELNFKKLPIGIYTLKVTGEMFRYSIKLILIE